MTDGIGNPKHQITEKPFNYNSQNTIEYENSKAGGQYKQQDMVDGIGNDKHQYTTPPYNPINITEQQTVNYDLNKSEGIGKSHDMVQTPNNWENTKKPYIYDKEHVEVYTDGNSTTTIKKGPNGVSVSVTDNGNGNANNLSQYEYKRLNQS